MSVTADRGQRATARLGAIVPLVVADIGPMLPRLGDQPDRPLEFAELMLMARISETPSLEISELVDEVVARTAANAERLWSLLDALELRGMLSAPGERPVPRELTQPSPPPMASPEPLDADGPWVLPTPFVLAVAGGDFVQLDHDGRTVFRLDPVEFDALTRFSRPVNAEAAFGAHHERAGELALDRSRFDDLVHRLSALGLLRPYDRNDLTLGNGYNKMAEEIRRQTKGRAVVGRAMRRSMDAYDEIEKAHRARTGTARPKVLPVHSITTDWRNPPLSLGLILAYAKAYEGGRLEEHFDFRPDWLLDEQRIDELKDEPAIYLFSSYLWSSANNLVLSAKAKELNPASITIHGGPNVPKYEADVINFFKDNPHVDITVRGEGEITTAEILTALAGKMGDGPVDLSILADVPGLTYRDGDQLVHTADRDRLPDLDVLPSPYLTGLFDAYVEGWNELALEGAAATDGWAYKLPVVVLETNRGCPYGCTFCDWGSATLSRIRKYSIERIFDEIQWCADNKVDTIGLADANFGIFERDVDIAVRVAESKLTKGFPKQFGTNYAKNTVKHLKRIVEELARADILTFGLLSLQSMDTDTLKVIERSNIKVERYEDLAAEFQRANLPLYVDLMVGLPGQTRRSFRNDLQECVNREVHAKLFPTYLLVNSPMNEPSYKARNGITTKPGQLVVEAASFTKNDYDAMMRSRRVFYMLEKFGTLRQVARYLRQETGIHEVDFYDGLAAAASAQPELWPTLHFTFETIPRFMVPPISWKLLLDEVRKYAVDELHAADDDALATVMAVQHALLPDRQRQFPQTVSLPHDYVAWHAAMIAAKQAGHLDDWPDHIVHLRSLGPGTLTVDDPRGVCTSTLGTTAEANPWETWDMSSPVCRPVALQD